jgi:hypothetical protein
MPNNHPCKTSGAPNCCRNLARRYLFSLAPIGPDLVLLATLEVLLWIA